MTTVLLPLFLATAARAQFDSYQFGNYADTTFNCPALVTCRQVCTTSLEVCAEIGLDCADGEDLCRDGVCRTEGSCDLNADNPCGVCAPVACLSRDLEGNRLPVDFQDACLEKYGEYYDACDGEEEDEGFANQFDWGRDPGFVVCYVWITSISLLIVGWCAWNQRFAPVGVAVSLQEFSATDNLRCRQTAYRAEYSGACVYWLTIATSWGIQFLLFLLTLFYYMQQGATGFAPVFEDEREVLLAFEVVWMVGFVWSFPLKWPASIRTLFLRRTVFSNATHVAVFSPSLTATKVVGVGAGDGASKETWCLAWIGQFITTMRGVIDTMMAVLFSDMSRRNGPGQVTFCAVEIDRHGGRSFYFKLRRYTYSLAAGVFEPGLLQLDGSTVASLIARKHGLSTPNAEAARSVVGENSIRLRAPSIVACLLDEFAKPFYLYQTFMTWTWFNLYFWHMGIVNTVVRIAGGVAVATVKFQNDRNLFRLSNVTGAVMVLRNGTLQTVGQRDIVPGDVIEVSPGMAHCDFAVLSGRLLVDESALTGEVTPISKTALDPSLGDAVFEGSRTHKANAISAGTCVMECGEHAVRAIVTSTGSFTAKGRLLRDILFYERDRFQFDVEVQIVVVMLACYAVACFVVVVNLLADDLVFAWFYGMYAVATALPPLLPTVFVVSVGISANRLLIRNRVASSNSQMLLVAGKVDTAFFDKTGTLTKQGLEFMSAQRCQNACMLPQGPPGALLGEGMAVCHTLAASKDEVLIGNAVDKMMFDSLEGATLVSTEAVEYTVTVPNQYSATPVRQRTLFTLLKRFEFSHTVMAQSVVVRDDAGAVRVFAKGSAEAIRALCDPATLPPAYDDMVLASAKDGIYQIAMAVADVLPGDFDGGLDVLTRDSVERPGSLTFLGFVNFKNALKTETPGVIAELHGGDIRTVMVTGDNIYTGIKIATECGMVSLSSRVLVGHVQDSKQTEEGHEGQADTRPVVAWRDARSEAPVILPEVNDFARLDVALAMTGDAWSMMLETSPDTASALADHLRVFGRCTPTHKVSVVEFFVLRGAITLMCGDGGNDCGALKTAHCGVALSDAEASIVSPFTSLDKSIVAVTDVLKEGRCCLASAFASYKYMIMYGQVETFLQIVNAYFSITFTEWCWVFMDGAWLLSLAFTLPLMGVADRLAKNRPTSSLLGLHTMSSVLGILAINYTFTSVGLAILFEEEWFQCRKWSNTDISSIFSIGDNYESTVLFAIGGFQYTASAVAFNFGFAHRAPWITNYRFVFFVTVWTLLHVLVTLVPSGLSCLFRVNCSNNDVLPQVTTSGFLPIQNGFATTLMPMHFRIILVGLMVANLAAVCCWEYYVVNGWLLQSHEGAATASRDIDNSMASLKYVPPSVTTQNNPVVHANLVM
jgi:cation-transporting ATPase 13A3/4/5